MFEPSGFRPGLALRTRGSPSPRPVRPRAERPAFSRANRPLGRFAIPCFTPRQGGGEKRSGSALPPRASCGAGEGGCAITEETALTPLPLRERGWGEGENYETAFNPPTLSSMPECSAHSAPADQSKSGCGSSGHSCRSAARSRPRAASPDTPARPAGPGPR